MAAPYRLRRASRGTVFEAPEPGLYVAASGDVRQYVAVNFANREFSDINNSHVRENTSAQAAGIPVLPPRTLVLHVVRRPSADRRGVVYLSPEDHALAMRLTFENYWPLIFLVIIPYLWWVRRDTAMDLSRKHLKLSTLLRSALVVGLVLALMQPVLYKSSSAVSVVYLLDVSNSVQPGAIKGALDWITKTNDAGRPDHAQFVAFGSNSLPFDTVEELRKVQVADAASRRLRRPERDRSRRRAGPRPAQLFAQSSQASCPDLRRQRKLRRHRRRSGAAES